MVSSSTFLGRLARDRRGNTIAIMAAAMVPLMGFAGSAVDMARLYVVKARLQQACDAGVLAGRKAMTDTSKLTPLDSTATSQANSFFSNNFPTGWYQTNTVSFTPVKSIDGADSTVANAVTGTAKATVPMAVMGFFGVGARDLTVSCQARFDLADTDVMFVLDTTGSMSCYPSDPASCSNTPMTSYIRTDGTTGYANPEKPAHTLADGSTEYSRIESLRRAVKLFDTTMRANADPTTHFRYGFVTYSSAVNVGKIIPSQYIQSGNWTYQSRHLSPTTNGTYANSAGDYNYGAATTFSFTGIPQVYCVAQRMPATGFLRTGPVVGSSGNAWSDAGYYQARYFYNLSWNGLSGGTCSGTQQPLRAMWRYEPTSTDVSAYVGSLNTGNAVTVPGRLDGLTSKWRGCIEEGDTSASTSFDVNALPDDLDPDFTPSVATDKWRPMWPEAVWLRSPNTSYQDVQDDQVDENRPGNGSYYYSDASYRGGYYYDRNGSAACGMPAQRLKVWSATEVANYVGANDFRPFGGTYHDVGMIWGTRMLSPDGIFKSDTAPWAGRNDPSRSIVFMTDGEMSPSLTSYGQYGVEAWDNRVTATNWGEQKDRHNARFRVECDAAKAKGITIYVVSVAQAPTADLQYCSSPGQIFQATSTDQLTDAFRSIAQRIAMLRLTQ